MANPYYDHGSVPATGSTGSSASMRAEFDAVEAGFDKLPTLSGYANKAVVVNGGGTALTTTSGSMSLAGDLTLAGALTTSGAYGLTFTLTALTSVTLPTSGTLATLAGTETLTNKTLNLANITLSGTIAQFNAACSDADFATLAGTETLTNKTLGGVAVSGELTNSSTSALQVSAGTTAQRPTGATGKIRYNSELGRYEGYGASAWDLLGGGATGGGTDKVFYENDQAVATDYTIPSTKNAMSAGPITINSGITVTISSGATWTVV